MNNLMDPINGMVDKKYFDSYRDFFGSELENFIMQFLVLMQDAKPEARYFFAGNGASAAVASHLANDFSKALSIRAHTFHDPALLTCFGNDYGYENWIAEAVNLYCEKGDILILISSSGRSKNIVNGASLAKKKGLKIVSLTGPNPDEDLLRNSLIKLCVKSDCYNIIECCHMIALCAVVDSCKLVTLPIFMEA